MRPPVAPMASAGTNMPVEAPTPLVHIMKRYVSLHDHFSWNRRLKSVCKKSQDGHDCLQANVLE